MTDREQASDDDLRDLREHWAERLERVRRSQARTDVRGMTRPPRDPVERAFLRRIGREGPFVEEPPPQKAESWIAKILRKFRQSLR